MNATLLMPKVYSNDTGIINVWDLPWPAVREFEIRHLERGATRGSHAHRTCDQIIRCSAGHCYMTTQTNDANLRSWDMGIGWAVLVPRMHWITLSEFSVDAVVTVLCSEPYSEPISDFEEFLRLGKLQVVGDKGEWF